MSEKLLSSARTVAGTALKYINSIPNYIKDSPEMLDEFSVQKQIRILLLRALLFEYKNDVGGMGAVASVIAEEKLFML